ESLTGIRTTVRHVCHARGKTSRRSIRMRRRLEGGGGGGRSGGRCHGRGVGQEKTLKMRELFAGKKVFAGCRSAQLGDFLRGKKGGRAKKGRGVISQGNRVVGALERCLRDLLFSGRPWVGGRVARIRRNEKAQ